MVIGRCVYRYCFKQDRFLSKRIYPYAANCKSHDIEIVLTKSISRFGRDTVEILDALNQLKNLGVRVIFEQEVLDTADTDNDLMISIIEC